jgi:hypothetical protein
VLLAGILFAVLSRPWSVWAAPVAVFLFLTLSSASVYASVKYLSNATRSAGGMGADPSWIDDAVGRDARVEFLDTAEITDPHVLWQSQFWNRSVRRIFGVTSQDPSLPDVKARLEYRTGRIVPSLPSGSPDRAPRYVVAASTVDVDGTRLAQSGILALFGVDGPLRLRSTIEGVQPDGWTGSSAAYNRYASAGAGSRVEVDLSRLGITGPPPARVHVVVGRLRVAGGKTTVGTGGAATTVTVANGKTKRVELRAPAAPFRVQVTVSPTFSPSQFGSADTRQLGVRVAFRVHP